MDARLKNIQQIFATANIFVWLAILIFSPVERNIKFCIMDVVTGGRDCPINSNKNTLEHITSAKQ
jgi:hypothetical protein